MGRGFGRGAKSVAIVTHAQAKGAKKMPRGLRGGSRRKKMRQQYAAAHDEQKQLEESMGAKAPEEQRDTKGSGRGEPKSLAQEIAGISIEHMVMGRKKGFKGVRKQLMRAAKDVKRRHVVKAQKRKLQEEKLLAEKHAKELRRLNASRNKL